MWLREIEVTHSKATPRRAVKIYHPAIVFNELVIEYLSQLDAKLKYYFQV